MEAMTMTEANLVKRLCHNVSDLNLEGHFDTDEFYLRWLRARDLQLDQAEEMLRKHIAWRQKYDIDNIKTWESKYGALLADYPAELCGYNKLGAPVLIVPFSRWDLSKGVEAGLRDDIIRYIDQAFEILEGIIRQRSTSERPVTQLDIILDVNGLSFWQLASKKVVELIMEVVKRFEDNHPEILHKGYVINVSTIFNILFNLVKPLLTSRTLSKVYLYSTQSNEWTSALLKDFNEDQLPTYFGGTCETWLKMYRESNKYRICSPPFKTTDVRTTISVKPGESVFFTFDVTRPNSILRWAFKTDYYDIQFSVYRADSKNRPIIKPTRFPSWGMDVKDEIKCVKPGQYIAEFNNTYGEIERARTLHYIFQVQSAPAPAPMNEIEITSLE